MVWYAEVVVPIFKKDNWMECFSYRGDHTSKSPWEGLSQGDGEERDSVR